jgi:hypothetical protein
MSNVWLGMLVFFGFWHLFLIAIPLRNVLRTKISRQSKVVWCAILILLPFIGVVIMHFLYGTGLFYRSLHQVSAAEERARSGTLAPRDDD